MRPIVRPKSVVSLILVSILSTFVPLAKAELTIHTSVDKNGDTQMLVNNEAQKQLPPPQLGITPPTLHDDLVLATGKLDKSLTLYNYSTKPKKIKLSMIDLDSSGHPITSSETTLKNWTLINPTTFSIAGSGYQTVRLSIRPPNDFVEQKYKAMLLIEQQIDNPLKYDADAKGVTVELGSRYGLPINVTVK